MSLENQKIMRKVLIQVTPTAMMKIREAALIIRYLLDFEGNFDASGQAFFNTTGDPNDLMIISAGDKVKIAGNADFYGQILAPYAEVSLLGTAEYWGAVIGETVKVAGDFNFHVDESSVLTDLIDTPAPALIK